MDEWDINKSDTQRYNLKGDYVYKRIGWSIPFWRYNYSTSLAEHDSFLSGRKNPHWRWQVKAGADASTEMVAGKLVGYPWHVTTNEYWNWDPLYVQDSSIEFQGNDETFFPIEYNDWNPIFISTEMADNEAKTRYVKKIRDMQTTFQGSVFAVELAKTISLIRNPARALRGDVTRFTNRLRSQANRRNFSKIPLRDRRRQLGDLWLEAQFGWRPLINDLDELMKALAESRHAVEPEKLRLFGVGEHTSSVTRKSRTIGMTFPLIDVNYRILANSSVKYVGLWDFSTYALHNQRVGFDPSNWGIAAWEIVPWSFLIDYFTNIGDIISALSLSRQGERYTVKTVRQEYLYEVENTEVTYSVSNYQREVVPGASTLHTNPLKRSRVQRYPWTGKSLTPRVEFSMPGSSTRWLNIAALAVSRDWTRNTWLTD